jgi:outer membrane protein W
MAAQIDAPATTPSAHELMTFACARALRVSALLAVPASAFAQSSRSPTIFSPALQSGTVSLRAAVVLADYTVKPLPLLKVVARRTDRPDSVFAQTDLDGRLTMPLQVGSYTLRAKTAQPIAGRSYAWSVSVVIRPSRTEAVQLSNANAVSDTVAPRPATVAVAPADSARVVAHVPAPTTAARVSAPVPAPVRTPVSAPASAPPVAAQSSPFVVPATRAQPAPRRANTSNLMLGLSFDASSIKSDDLTGSTKSGAGAAAQLGWGFTKNFAIVIDASVARITTLDGDFNLTHVDLGGRWHFVSARSGFVPFVEVGYSGRAATQQDALMTDDAGNMYTGDLAILGGGVSLGGGFQYFLTPKWAVGSTVKWTTGQFTRVQFDNISVDGLGIDATSARVNMGFTWFPMGR